MPDENNNELTKKVVETGPEAIQTSETFETVVAKDVAEVEKTHSELVDRIREDNKIVSNDYAPEVLDFKAGTEPIINEGEEAKEEYFEEIRKNIPNVDDKAAYQEKELIIKLERINMELEDIASSWGSDIDKKNRLKEAAGRLMDLYGNDSEMFGKFPGFMQASKKMNEIANKIESKDNPGAQTGSEIKETIEMTPEDGMSETESSLADKDLEGAEEKKHSQENWKNCPKCGNAVPASNKFCNKCGKEYSAEEFQEKVKKIEEDMNAVMSMKAKASEKIEKIRLLKITERILETIADDSPESNARSDTFVNYFNRLMEEAEGSDGDIVFEKNGKRIKVSGDGENITMEGPNKRIEVDGNNVVMNNKGKGKIEVHSDDIPDLENENTGSQGELRIIKKESIQNAVDEVVKKGESWKVETLMKSHITVESGAELMIGIAMNSEITVKKGGKCIITGINKNTDITYEK